MNDASSRSHAIVTLHVENTLKQGATGPRVKRRAQLHCVDLAGSERLANAGESEVRQKESKQINKSLWALSLMISSLSRSQESTSSAASMAHIPYRNSKL